MTVIAEPIRPAADDVFVVGAAEHRPAAAAIAAGHADYPSAVWLLPGASPRSIGRMLRATGGPALIRMRRRDGAGSTT